jgi:hypothetical protein
VADGESDTVHLSSTKPQALNRAAAGTAHGKIKPFWISTKSVNNYVEKRGLDTLDMACGAAFNKLPIGEASTVTTADLSQTKAPAPLTAPAPLCGLRQYAAPLGLEQNTLDDFWPHTVGLQVFDRRHDAEFTQGRNAAGDDIALAGIGSQLGHAGSAWMDVLRVQWFHR